MPLSKAFLTILLSGLLIFSACSQSAPETSSTDTKVDYKYEPSEAELAELPDDVVNGDAAAQYEVALQYSNGDGVDKDYQKARYWYEESAAQDYVDAYYGLAWVYFEGGHGVEQDYEEARNWYKKALGQKGEYNNDAATLLGSMYMRGQGGPKNYDKAYDLYEEASQTGVASGNCGLGYMYMNGYAVEKDYDSAKYYYGKSIEGGDTGCLYEMGWMLDQGGYGIEPDHEKAQYYYQKTIDEASDAEDIAAAKEALKS